MSRDKVVLRVRTHSDTASERRGRDQLLRLLARYDVQRWLFTREVVIQQSAIPHSHPVLTLSCRHLNDDDWQLAVFLHEQFHWFVSEKSDKAEAAIDELRTTFPHVPVGPPDGGRDERSTYLHLIVCYLEMQAARELLGAESAQTLFEKTVDYYRWVYEQILQDEGTLLNILQRHGFYLP